MRKKSDIKILFYDVETSPNLAYVWGKYEQNVIKFKKRRELLSFAYSYLGDSEIKLETREGEKSDEALAKKLHAVLQDADIVVAHNGDKFDQRVARARMIKFGLPPLKNLTTVDTRKSANAHFQFEGNSLQDLAEFFELGGKKSTPGFSLWEGCMADDPKSWRTMGVYNKHDVKLLKGAYKIMRPWIENHPSIGRLIDPHRRNLRCPNCGSKDIQSRGNRVTRKSSYKRWQCQSVGCGAWFDSSLNETGAKK